MKTSGTELDLDLVEKLIRSGHAAALADLPWRSIRSREGIKCAQMKLTSVELQRVKESIGIDTRMLRLELISRSVEYSSNRKWLTPAMEPFEEEDIATEANRLFTNPEEALVDRLRNVEIKMASAVNPLQRKRLDGERASMLERLYDYRRSQVPMRLIVDESQIANRTSSNFLELPRIPEEFLEVQSQLQSAMQMINGKPDESWPVQDWSGALPKKKEPPKPKQVQPAKIEVKTRRVICLEE